MKFNFQWSWKWATIWFILLATFILDVIVLCMGATDVGATTLTAVVVMEVLTIIATTVRDKNPKSEKTVEKQKNDEGEK